MKDPIGRKNIQAQNQQAVAMSAGHKKPASVEEVARIKATAVQTKYVHYGERESHSLSRRLGFSV